MSFSFGFSGDDVEDENDVFGQNGSTDNATAGAGSEFVGLPAEEHTLDELVGTENPLLIISTISPWQDMQTQRPKSMLPHVCL